MWQRYWKAFVAQRRVGSIRQSGTSFCQAIRARRHAVLGVELGNEEDSTRLWMKVLRRCFVGGQLRV